MFYSLVRKTLFTLKPETAHKIALQGLKYSMRGPIASGFKQRVKNKPRTVMGIEFPNPVGLAAGLDRHCEYMDALAPLGFGFLEVGTVTLNKQSGHPKPRLFRIPEKQALINRMGFYSKGLEHALVNLRKSHYRGVLGISIVKSFKTPLDKATPEYLQLMESVYPYATFITANISSPNTPGLRDLQYTDYLNELLAALKQKQAELTRQHNRYVPLCIKVAPELSDDQIKAMAAQFIQHKIDGVIAVNTSLLRDGVEGLKYADKPGGLSGAPLFPKALHVVGQFHQALQGKAALIGLGGIMSGEDGKAMLDAGADLVQVFTGFVYKGPSLILEIVEAG